MAEKLKIEEVLEKEGKYVGPTVGVSMRPMLKEGRDTIVVLAKKERLKPLDVALYIRGAIRTRSQSDGYRVYYSR